MNLLVGAYVHDSRRRANTRLRSIRVMVSYLEIEFRLQFRFIVAALGSVQHNMPVYLTIILWEVPIRIEALGIDTKCYNIMQALFSMHFRNTFLGRHFVEISNSFCQNIHPHPFSSRQL